MDINEDEKLIEKRVTDKVASLLEEGRPLGIVNKNLLTVITDFTKMMDENPGSLRSIYMGLYVKYSRIELNKTYLSKREQYSIWLTVKDTESLIKSLEEEETVSHTMSINWWNNTTCRPPFGEVGRGIK